MTYREYLQKFNGWRSVQEWLKKRRKRGEDSKGDNEADNINRYTYHPTVDATILRQNLSHNQSCNQNPKDTRTYHIGIVVIFITLPIIILMLVWFISSLYNSLDNKLGIDRIDFETINVNKLKSPNISIGN
jgi:hypothetical protein